MWILSVKLLFIFILYLIIEYCTQFSQLLSKLTPLAEHSVKFANYTTSLLWDSLAILYSPLRRTNFIQTTKSTEIDLTSSALSAVFHIPDAMKETPDHQFFSSNIDHSKVRIYFFKVKVDQMICNLFLCVLYLHLFTTINHLRRSFYCL